MPNPPTRTLQFSSFAKSPHTETSKQRTTTKKASIATCMSISFVLQCNLSSNTCLAHIHNVAELILEKEKDSQWTLAKLMNYSQHKHVASSLLLHCLKQMLAKRILSEHTIISLVAAGRKPDNIDRRKIEFYDRRALVAHYCKMGFVPFPNKWRKWQETFQLLQSTKPFHPDHVSDICRATGVWFDTIPMRANVKQIMESISNNLNPPYSISIQVNYDARLSNIN